MTPGEKKGKKKRVWQSFLSSGAKLMMNLIMSDPDVAVGQLLRLIWHQGA